MRSDAELVNAVLAGERDSFGELVERHERGVRIAVFALLCDHHTSLDVTQDAFIAAYEHLRDLRDPAAFGGWLLRIARRRALNAIRARREVEPLQAEGPTAPEPPAPALEKLQERLLAAVLRLPEHERVVLSLTYFSGHKLSEVAVITGRPLGTVTVQLGRARQRLREWLKDTDHEP